MHTVPTLSSSGRKNNDRPIVIEVPVIIDNRIFGQAVKKVVLEDFGLQV